MTTRWLDQVESLARDALPEPVFHYVAAGAREEVTLGEAVTAWQAIRVAPRVLQDVRRVTTATRLLGTPFDLPIGVAPMTLLGAADPDGEVAELGYLLFGEDRAGTREGLVEARGQSRVRRTGRPPGVRPPGAR